jgi:hypothetical protein
MGSSYLIAHGLGKPVADASTEFEVAEAGEYKVWVMTLNWTKRLERPESAGRFKVAVNGVDVDAGKLKRIKGKFFADFTGHGFVGMWSGADSKATEKGRMGMSKMWTGMLEKSVMTRRFGRSGTENPRHRSVRRVHLLWFQALP